MRYKSIYSIEFDADSDDVAQSIAHKHHQQLRDDLRIEGADHPIDLVLEQIVANDIDGSRELLDHPEQEAI